MLNSSFNVSLSSVSSQIRLELDKYLPEVNGPLLSNLIEATADLGRGTGPIIATLGLSQSEYAAVELGLLLLGMVLVVTAYGRLVPMGT